MIRTTGLVVFSNMEESGAYHRTRPASAGALVLRLIAVAAQASSCTPEAGSPAADCPK